MKELSIEEKAKACDSNYKNYAELINRLEDVKEAIKKQNYGIAMDVLCKPYPEFQVTTHSELKENEDEKIKKAILWCISTVEHEFGCKVIEGFAATELKSWLEKQGKNNMGISEATKHELEDNLNKALEKETPESWNKFLDEQGEQKLVEKYNITGIGSKNAQGKLGEMIKNLKPADKVEPKLKIEEGKWYVCTQTYVLRGKIVVIKGQTYQVEKDNVIKGEDGCLFIDRHDGKASEYFRYWTIQDAKDGDVLFTSSTASHETFIFKNIDEKGNVKCYFTYDSEDGFREGKYHFIGRATYCKPATKEQRDLLFQKMKEAGYEWDAEKKELKKIEQKPAWSEEDEKIIEEIINDIECARAINYHAPKEGYEFRENWLKSLKQRI